MDDETDKLLYEMDNAFESYQRTADRRQAREHKMLVERYLADMAACRPDAKIGTAELNVIVNKVDPQKLYNLPEVGRLLGVSRHAVRLWCVNGHVPAVQLKTRGTGQRKHRRVTGWTIIRLAKDMLKFLDIG